MTQEATKGERKDHRLEGYQRLPDLFRDAAGMRGERLNAEVFTATRVSK